MRAGRGSLMREGESGPRRKAAVLAQGEWMRRAVSIVLLLVALAAAGATFSAGTTLAVGSAPQVTIVLAPYLTWDQISPTTTPVLWRLAGSGAVGNVGVRVRTTEPGEPASPLEGALTMSAGDWAAPDYSAPAAFNVTEAVGPVTAAAAYRTLTGRPVGSSAIAYLGLPATVCTNADAEQGAVLGTLGSAVRGAGGTTAAVGNSDTGESTPTLAFLRPAGVVAADERGLVGLGDVSRDLLVRSPAAPYGWKTSLTTLASALRAARSSVSGSSGPTLVVVDPGDAYRAKRYEPQVGADVAAAQSQAALAELDGVVGIAESEQPKNGVLVVVSQALSFDWAGAPQGFGPLFVSGPGWDGYLTSDSTHRTGLATQPDVTASALSVLGIRRPVQVSGSAVTEVPTPADAAARIAYLSGLNRTALAVDSGRPRVIDSFLVLVAVVLAFATLLFAIGPHVGPRVNRVLVVAGELFVLFAAALPVSSWLQFIIVARPSSGPAAESALVGVALVLALVAWAAGAFFRSHAALAAVALFSVAVLLGDQWLGGPLSFTNFFGYSPLGSARFYGMGNEAAALTIGATLVGVALVFDEWSDAPWSAAARRFGLAGLGAVVVVTAAAPMWGANFGVAIWGTIGFVVAWALMNGRRVTWKTAMLAVLLVVLLFAAFAALDLLGGGEQTHLGRSLASAAQGGVGQLALIVQRKTETNLRVLGQTNWSWLLAAALALFAFLRVAFRRRFDSLLTGNPQFARALIAAIVTGVLAFFTEDSGIVIPSLIALWAGLGLAWLALHSASGEGEAS